MDAQSAIAEDDHGCGVVAGRPSFGMSKQIDLDKIEQLQRRLYLTRENASKYQRQVENLARAAATDKAWAKEELTKKAVQIQKLETENDNLRRSNVVLRRTINQTSDSYRNLAQRINNCPRCMQSWNTADASMLEVPTETEGEIRQSEIRQNLDTLSWESVQSSYPGRILHPGGLSRLNTTVADTRAVNPAAQSRSAIGEAPMVLSALLPADITSSESNSSSLFTDASSTQTSRETHPSPVSSCGDSSAVSTSRNAWPITKGLHEEGEFTRQAIQPTTRPERPVISEQSLHCEDPLVKSPLPHRSVPRGPIMVCEKTVLPGTPSVQECINNGSSPLSRASSDVSMQSASEPQQENETTVDVDADEQVSDNLSEQSSNGSNGESDPDSDVDMAITVDAGEEEIAGKCFSSASREASMTPRDHQRGELRENASSPNYGTPSRTGPSLSYHRKRPAGQRLNPQLISTEARPAASNARSPTAIEVATSRTPKLRASHKSMILGNPGLTVLRSNTQAQPTPSTLPVCLPATAGHLQDQDASRGEEDGDVDLKTAIRESYARFGLSAQRLRFCHEPQTLDPFSINLNTNWKRRSKLDESIIEKLLQMGLEIATFLPQPDSERATKKETDLIRRLCHLNRPQAACSSLKEVVGTLRQERDVTKDELNLIEFEIYSTLIVMKCQSESEFEETVSAFSDYQCNLLGMYNSLHTFLAQLNKAWEGLHLLVLVYLLRVGTGRLVKYFVPTTRPAAIELLLQRFGNPELMANHCTRLQHLVSLSGTACIGHIQRTTPLKRLQTRMARVVEPPVARAALGYTSQYQSDVESDSSQKRYSMPASVPLGPGATSPSTSYLAASRSLDYQRRALSVPESQSPNTETPCLPMIVEQSRLRKSPSTDPGEHEGQHKNRHARKRRYGIDRLASYNAGGSVDDAALSFPEGVPKRNIVNSPVPRSQSREASDRETQVNSRFDDYGATEDVENLCADLHKATDLVSPWSQIPAATIDGSMQTQALLPRDDGDRLPETNSRSPSFYLYDQWLSNTVQQAPPAIHQEPVARPAHRKSPATHLPQEVIESVENGTVDPRALNLR